MRFGCFMSPLHPIGEDLGLLYQRDLELVQTADGLNFDEMWIGEHHSAGWGTIGSPELFIAAAAERTRRIKLATGVIGLPYHHPFMVAERAVQLDIMTRGRFILGVGAGAVVSDMHMLGIPASEARTRTAQAMETIVDLVRGNAVTRDEGWFRLQEARLQLRPFTPGGMEMVVASAATTFGVRLAGRLGVSVLSHAAPPWGSVRPGRSMGMEELAAQWDCVQEEAASVGLSASRDNWRLVIPIHVGPTRAEALDDIRAGWLGQRTDLWRGTLGIPMSGSEPSSAKAFDATVEGGGVIAGDVDDVITGIQKLEEITGGFGTLLISCQDWASADRQRRSLDLFARFVAPFFRGSVNGLRASNEWVATNSAAFQEANHAARMKAMER
jgi:limonene 1,2-monooxygenase